MTTDVIAAINQVVITGKDESGDAWDSAAARATKFAGDVEASTARVNQLLAIIGAGVSIKGFIDMLEQTLRYEAELGRLADRAGMTAEALSSMRLAAADSGETLDQIATMSARLSKALFDAQDGTTKAAKALELLGLDARTLIGLPTDQAMLAVAGALIGVRDGAAKTAVEMELLGRSGATAGAFLKELATQGLATAQATNEQVQAARDAEARFNRLADSSQQLKIAIANALLPTVSSFVEKLVEMSTSTSLVDRAAALLKADAELLGAAWRNSIPATILKDVASLAGAQDQAAQATKNWGGEANRARDALRNLDASISAMAVDVNRLNSLIAQIEGKDLGIGAGFAANFQLLTQAFNHGLITLERYQQLSADLLNQQPWATKQAEAARQAAAEQQRLVDQQIAFLTSMHEQTTEIGMTTAELLHYQAVLHDVGVAAEDEIAKRLRAIGIQQEQKKVLDDLTKGWEANDAGMQKLTDDQTRYQDSLVDLNRALQLQLDTLGMSSTQAQIFALNQQLAAAAAAGNTYEVQLLTDAIAKLNAIAAKQDFLDAAKTAEQAWKDTANSIERDLESGFDAAFKKGQSFGEALRNALDNMFKTLVLRPILQPIAGDITDVLAQFGLVSPSNKTAFDGGTISALGNIPGLSTLFSRGAAGTVAGGGGAVFGAGDLLEGLGAGGATFADLGLGAAGLGLAKFIPYVGIGLAVASALGLFDKNPTQVSGQFGILPTGGPSSTFEDNALTTNKGLGLDIGFLDQGTSEFSGHAAQVFNQIVSGAIDAFATRFSPEQSAAFATTLKNMTFQAFSGTFTTEDFIQKYGGQILQQVATAGLQILDPALAAAEQAFSGTADQVATFTNTLLSLYDVTKNLPDAVRANIDSALDGTQETADKALAFAQVLTGMGSSFSGLSASMEKLSGTDIPALVDSFGSVDNFVKANTYVYDNFTTTAQKAIDAQTTLTNDWAQAGVTMQDLANAGLSALPTTHAQFLQLINSLDLTTEHGRQLYAMLEQTVAPAFVAVYGTADQAAGAVDGVSTALQTLADRAHNLSGSDLQSAQAFFNQNFLTPDEQQTEKLVEDHQKLREEMSTYDDQIHQLGYATIPTTIDGFKKFYDAAVAAYGANSDFVKSLLLIAPSVLDIANAATDAATTISDAASTITQAMVSVSAINQSATADVDALLQKFKALSDASTGDFGDKLGVQIGLVTDAISQAQDQLAAEFQATGGKSDATTVYLNKEIAKLQDANTQMADDLARFTVLKAQYGASIAEQLVDLEDWDKQQQAIFKGYADALAALDQIYHDKWNTIINGTGDAVDGALSQLQKLQQGIAQYLQGLQVGQLSPLTPQQQLASAQQAYEVELTKALSGDQGALGDITKYADTYLQQARSFYASSQPFVDIFDQVTGQLGALAGTAPDGTMPLNAADKALLSALPTNAKIASGDDITALGNKFVAALKDTIAALADAGSQDSKTLGDELVDVLEGVEDALSRKPK